MADFESWWETVCLTGRDLKFTSIALPLTRRDGTRQVLNWTNPDGRDATAQYMEATVPIRDRRQGAKLRAGIEIAFHDHLESAGQRIALFSRLMGDHSLQSLPETTRRIRSRGPAGEKSPVPSSGSNGNGHGPDDANGRRLFSGDKGQPNLLPRSPVDPPSLPVGPLLQLISPRLRVGKTTGLAAMRGSADLPPAELRGRDLAGLRVAIVHDFLYCYAGAERVLEQILMVFPSADLFSLFDFVPENERGFLHNKPVKTTFIQQLPFARRKHRMYLPLMPLAIEQLDMSQYDIVISSSYLAAKGVLTGPDQLHVSYCHTPVRFAWDLQHQYLGSKGWAAGIKSLLPRVIFHYIRNWDVRSSNGVDVFVTNSDYVGRRIEKVYRRRSETIYPPVDTDRFTPGSAKEDFYLTASRLVPYKRVDLIVEAFNGMPDRRLIVVGDGPEFEKIRAKAGPNIKMVGQQPFEKLRQYMQMARAFVFAAEEDFGIAPVEALACGTPVIAFGRGGVTESVVAGQSGIFFADQTPQSVRQAVDKFERSPDWDAQRIHEHARRFSSGRFRHDLHALVDAEWQLFLDRRIEMSRIGRFVKSHADANRADAPAPATQPFEGAVDADLSTPTLLGKDHSL